MKKTVSNARILANYPELRRVYDFLIQCQEDFDYDMRIDLRSHGNNFIIDFEDYEGDENHISFIGNKLNEFNDDYEIKIDEIFKIIRGE